MAIAVQMDFQGATLEQYDKVIQKMGFTPGGTGGPGGLFHWVAKTPDGIRVTDVWETLEQFESFSRDQIGPYTAEAGIPSPPQVTVFAVHNYLTKG